MKADYYKILSVSHTASATEIKQSYRRLAFALHPDRNSGCPLKLAEFKRLSEAYQTLMDHSKRREYDNSNGYHRYNRNRSSPPPPDYRKVYAPRPPPDWKFVWDHKKHWEMHYGDGFRKEAIRMMMREQSKQENHGYQSPLGKGFSFSYEPGERNHNPFSKRPQGPPPKVVFEYEEVERDVVSGRDRLLHRDRIVRDMHDRRAERKEQQQQHQHQQRAKTTFASAATSFHHHQRPNRNQECIIL